MKKFAFIIWCLSGLSAGAQTRPLTLEEAIATSLQNNYDIQLSQNDSLLAALDYAYSKYIFLPRLNASANTSRNNNSQRRVLSDGTKRESSGIVSSNVNAALNLNWTLFDGMRMFIARQRLGQLTQLSEIQIKDQVINTVANVMRTYFDIIRQEQQLQAIEEQMQLSQERLQLAKYKFDIGTGAKPDVLQAQIDLNGQKSAHLVQQTNINNAKEQLNQLLVVDRTTDYMLADTTISYNAALTLDSIQSGIANSNPQLLIARKNRDIAELDLRERKAQRFPTVSFNSAYVFSRTNNRTVIDPFQPLFNQNQGLNYGFTAAIPIFNNYDVKRQIKAAELNIQYQKLVYDRNVTQLNTSVANAYRDYDLNKKALALEEENIVLVRENLMIARERYRLGVSTFLEMREAQQSLAVAMLRLIQARYNIKNAEIELLRLRGDIVR